MHAFLDVMWVYTYPPSLCDDDPGFSPNIVYSSLADIFCNCAGCRAISSSSWAVNRYTVRFFPQVAGSTLGTAFLANGQSRHRVLPSVDPKLIVNKRHLVKKLKDLVKKSQSRQIVVDPIRMT